MPTDDELPAELLDRLLAEESAEGPCLDAERVSAVAEGRLAGADRTAAIRHVATCVNCRDWVADTAAAIDGAPVPAVRPQRRSLLGWAAAAAVLVAAGGWWAFHGRGVASTETAVASAAERLRRDHADVFRDFAPLTAAELSIAGPGVERGGLTLVAPRGAFLGGRPEFEWRPVPGTAEYVVTVRDEDGAMLLERRTAGERLRMPQDAPPIATGARIVWKVTARAPGREVGGSLAARRLTDDEAARYRRGVDLLRAGGSARGGDLLAAHWAIRFGLYAEARRALGAVPPGASDLERATEAYLDRRLGPTGSR